MRQHHVSNEPLHDKLIWEFDLQGRVAVITGAGSGIGQETACVFAEAGAHVVLADVNAAGLAETAELVASLGGAATTHVTDISYRVEIDALADAALHLDGRLDAWVNAAGVLVSCAILEAEEAELDRILTVNVKGTYWGCAAAGRAMKPQGRGSIVNISSKAADNPAATLSAYALSKAGINMLTRTAAVEFGAFGCRVNAIAPGFVDTPTAAIGYLDPGGRVDPRRRDDFLSARARATPLGVTGRPRDIALAAFYLASDASRLVTGQVLRPNGGIAML